MDDKWSLNFKDEISLRGVNCNIPLVSEWYITKQRVRWRSIQGNEYDEDAFYVLAGNNELIISGRVNAREAKGILVLSRKGVYKCFRPKTFHLHLVFLSLNLKDYIWFSLFSLGATILLQIHQNFSEDHVW